MLWTRIRILHFIMQLVMEGKTVWPFYWRTGLLSHSKTWMARSPLK
ncbi:hypothetical protein Goari_005762 [Gossypium aridum]|uniref:Uncharacterized protein n=1 Tax=Gossypium aridum TaxID=34290 RepID=A0A7J8XKX5_GOSAI|nr:hypothetical protein [Gossypium aridum]